MRSRFQPLFCLPFVKLRMYGSMVFLYFTCCSFFRSQREKTNNKKESTAANHHTRAPSRKSGGRIGDAAFVTAESNMSRRNAQLRPAGYVIIAFCARHSAVSGFREQIERIIRLAREIWSYQSAQFAPKSVDR
jgi:hypothetical protein